MDKVQRKLPPLGSIVHVLISYDVSEYRVIGHRGKDQLKVVYAHDDSVHPLEHIVSRWWERVDDIPKHLSNGAC